MQRTRPFTTERIYGMGFVIAVLIIIICIHLAFVLTVWTPKLPRLDAVLVLFIYHLFFLNLLATFYQCIRTDPGIVPPNWGFYMGDETKRRRYCKMCNVWKPDRTHHCSICNRCILNMDHHCPWINNCVGFYNRKFFMQLLLYVFASLLIIVLTTIPEGITRISILLNSDSHEAHKVDVGAWYIVATVFIGLAWCMSLLL